MRSLFEDPSFTSGVANPDEKPVVNDQDRTGWQTVKDTAIDLAARPVLGMARSVTGFARDMADDPSGNVAAVDRSLGDAERYLEEQRSPRAKRIDTLDPTQAEYWNANNAYGLIPTIHHALPLAGYALPIGAGAKAATGLLGLAPRVASKVAAGVGMAGFGGLGLKDADNKLRDFADNTPREDLDKSPVFQDLWREFQGDEQAARNQLYKRMLDPVARATNFGANVLTFGALKGLGPFSGLIGRILFGAGEGAIVGPAGGAAGAYSQQLGQVKAGMQEEIDPQKITEGMQQGLAMVGPVAGMHAIHGRAPEKALDTSPPPGTPPETQSTTTGGVDPALTTTLSGQLNDPTKIDRDLQTRIMAQQQSQGYEALAQQRGIAPYGPPAPPNQPPPPPPPGGAGPAPPGGPPTAMNTGAPPPAGAVQQPTITVTPPGAAGQRQRTPPVTPQPTGQPAPAAAPAPAAGPPTAGPKPVEQRMWNGKVVNLVDKPPRMDNGVVYMTVVDDGKIAYAPVAELSPVTPEVAPTQPAAAAAPGAPVAPAAPTHTPGPAIWRSKDSDYPVTVSDEPPQPGPDGQLYQKVTYQGQESHVPAAELQAVPGAAPAAAAPAAPAAVAPGSKGTPEYIGWLADKTKEVVDKATRLNLVDKIAELSKTKTAAEVSTALNGALSAGEVRLVRNELGMPALGPVGIKIGGVDIQGPAATAPVAPGSKGKPVVDKIKAKADVKAAEQVKTQALAEDLQTAPEGELKQALHTVANPRADFEELQAAADWGRANNRQDIVEAAAAQADRLAAKVAKRTPRADYTGKKLEDAQTQLGLQATLAREAAAKVRGTVQEPVRKVTETPDVGTSTPKVTSDVTGFVAPRTGGETMVATKPVEAAAKPAPASTPRKAPRVDTSLSATSLERGDVVTTATGKTYEVVAKSNRPKYPEDPLVEIRRPGMTETEVHRSSELDAEQPAKSIARAAEEKKTKAGRARLKAEPLQVEPGKAVARGGRTPPVEHPAYEKYVGKNAAGHEVWENPKTNLRVTRRVEDVQETKQGKPVKRKMSVVNVEHAVVDRAIGESGRYERGANFRVSGERPVVPARRHEPWADKPETTPEHRPRLSLVQKETARTEKLDTDLATSRMDTRIERATQQRADRRAQEAARGKQNVPRLGRLLTGLERALNGEINRFHGEPTQQKWTELRARAVKADAARTAAGLRPAFVNKLGRAPDVGGGPLETVRPSFQEVKGQTTEEYLGRQLILDIRQLSSDEKRISIDEFDRRRQALLDRAIALDVDLIDKGQEPRFEKTIPEVIGKSDLRSDVQRADDLLKSIDNPKMRDLPGGLFFQHPAVRAYFDLVKKINDDVTTDTVQSRMTGPAEVFPFRLHPDWINQKISGYRSAAHQPTALEREAQSALTAAKTFYDAHIKAYTARKTAESKVDVIDKHGLSAAQDEKVTALLREQLKIKTDVEQAPVSHITDELRKKIADEVIEKGLPGSVEDYIKMALDHMSEEQRAKVTTQAGAGAKARQRSKRDEVIDYAMQRTLHDHFAGKDGKIDLKKLDEFLNKLIGIDDLVPVKRTTKNATTGEVTTEIVNVSRSLLKPVPPDIVVKGPQPARKGGEISKATIKKYDEAVKLYAERYKFWEGQIRSQIEATTQLRQLMRGLLSRVEHEIANYKKTTEDPIGSIKWELPTGEPTSSGYMRFRSGKNDSAFQFYNFANDLQKVLNHLDVDLAVLKNSTAFKGDMAGWDITSSPFTQYTRKLSPVLQQFGLDVRNYIHGNMEALNTGRAERVAEDNKKFQGKQATTTEAETGEHVPLDPNRVPDARSVTSEVPEGSWTEAIEDRIDAERAKKLKDEGKAGDAVPNQSEASKQNVEPKDNKVGTRELDGNTGLPVDGKRFVKGEPYVEDDVDAAHAALQTADPTHPLIDKPITTSDLVDIVKQMMREGADTGDMSTAITPRFLDQIARVTAGTRVVHAPYDVVSKAGTDHPAYYNADHDVIALPKDTADFFYAPTAVHEVTHSFFMGVLQRDHIVRGDMEQLLERARDYARKSGMVPKDYDFTTRFSKTEGYSVEPRQLYGLRSPNEMIAEAKASQGFRQFLTRVPSGHDTIGNKIKNVLNSMYRVLRDGARRLLGNRNGDTALDVLFYDQSNVLGRIDAMMGREIRNAERLGRVKFRSGLDPALSYAPNPNDYVHPAVGTEFVDQQRMSNLRGSATSALSRTVDMGRQLRDINRGIGLSLHTAFDKEHRTSDYEFRNHVHALNEAVFAQHARTREIMDFEDGPVIEKVHRFLAGLAPGHRDRVRAAFTEFNYHRAFPDAPVGERDAAGKLTGKNKHIDPDDLANAQIVQQHEHVQKLWNDIAKIPGTKQLADDTWGFYRKRNAQMKSRFVRRMAELDGILPKDTPANKREAVIDALEKHITSVALTDADKRALSGIDLENEKVAEKVRDIRKVSREFSHVEGPYLPMVREGDYAVYGRFHMPEGMGERVPSVDRRNGQPTDNGIRVFKSDPVARKFVEKITKEFGITQTDGGVWYYDPATGNRALRYTPEELAAVNAKLDKGDTPIKNRLIRGAEAKDAIAAGRALEQRHWVEFSPQVLEKYDRLYDARQSVKNWRNHFDDKRLSITPPEQSHARLGNQSEQVATDTMQKLINRFKAGDVYAGLDPHEQAGTSQELRYISNMIAMRRGVRQRYQPRGYVLGAMNDMVRALSDYSGATAGWLSKQEHMPAISRAWENLNAYVESRRFEHGDRDSFARTAIRDAMGQRIHKQAEPLIDNLWNRTIDRIVRWTMLDKLPGVSYFVANGTEAGVLGIPIQLGRHGLMDIIAAHRYAHSIVGPLKTLGAGLHDTGRALMNKRAVRNYRDDFVKRVLKDKYGPGIVDALNYMHKMGLMDQHSSLEYQQMARRAEHGVMGVVDKTADYLTNVFQAFNTSLENFTRATMGISSYKLERDRLAKIDPNDPNAHEKALRYLWDVVNRTSGVYGNQNAPMLFQKGPIARLIFEFKKYPQRIMANNINAAMGALKLFDPAVRADPVRFAEAKEKARTLAALLVMQGSAAGALGMPTEIFSVPVNAMYIAGLTPYNWEDYKADFRKWAGEIPSYGLLRATGIDFQAKLDQSNMIFFGPPQSTKAMDLRGPVLGILGGAGSGQIADLLTAGQKLAQAHHAEKAGNMTLASQLRWEAARLGIPVKLLSDFIESETMGTQEGRAGPSGRPKGAPLTGAEKLAKYAGFNPTRISNEQEKARVLRRLEDRYKTEAARWTLEYTTGNPSEQTKVWASIQQWNKNLPQELQLQRGQLIKAANTRAKAQAQSLENAGVALDRRGKAFLPQLKGVYD